MTRLAPAGATAVLKAEGGWLWEGMQEEITMEVAEGNAPARVAGRCLLFEEDVRKAIEGEVGRQKYCHAQGAVPGDIGTVRVDSVKGLSEAFMCRGKPVATSETEGTFAVVVKKPSEIPGSPPVYDPVPIHQGSWRFQDVDSELVTEGEGTRTQEREGESPRTGKVGGCRAAEYTESEEAQSDVAGAVVEVVVEAAIEYESPVFDFQENGEGVRIAQHEEPGLVHKLEGFLKEHLNGTKLRQVVRIDFNKKRCTQEYGAGRTLGIPAKNVDVSMENVEWIRENGTPRVKFRLRGTTQTRGYHVAEAALACVVGGGAAVKFLSMHFGFLVLFGVGCVVGGMADWNWGGSLAGSVGLEPPPLDYRFDVEVRRDGGGSIDARHDRFPSYFVAVDDRFVYTHTHSQQVRVFPSRTEKDIAELLGGESPVSAGLSFSSSASLE